MNCGFFQLCDPGLKTIEFKKIDVTSLPAAFFPKHSSNKQANNMSLWTIVHIGIIGLLLSLIFSLIFNLINKN